MINSARLAYVVLNHVFGLPSYEALMYNEWQPELTNRDPRNAISGNQDIMELLINKRPPVYFSPGEKWEYSNTGYILLASIVHKASGMPFEEYLKKEVFEPAGIDLSTKMSWSHGKPKKRLLVQSY